MIYIPERDHTFPATSPERPFYGFSVAGMNIAAYCASRLREVGFEAVFDPGTPVSEEKGEIIEVSMHDFSPEAAIWLAFCGAGEARSEEGHLLARKSGENGLSRVFTRKEAAIERLVYPWDLLEWQERVMEKMEWEDFSGREGVYVMGTLRVGEGTVIMPGVVVEGAVWAGDGCRIGPNCYLRGCVSLGNGCVVGQGVELKNCIIGDGTFIPHLSYAGDSIIGSDVNFGAGTVCSNFRHDGGEHRMVAGGKLETSLAPSLETMFGWVPIPSFCRGGFFLPVLGPDRGKSSRGHESGKGILLILKRPHAEKRLPACSLWRMVKVASAAPAAAHHQGSQPQQAQGSCGCFRHRKHNAVIKFDVVDIHSAVHGAGISKRSSKLGACQGGGGWIPLGNRTCQSAVDIHGKRLGGKIGNDAQISPAALLEIRPGQSRIDISASLAAEPLIVEV